MDMALSSATTSGQSESGNVGVLHIPQNPSITETSPSDCLVSYLGHSLGGPAPLQRCSQCRLGNTQLNDKTVLFQIIQFSISTQFWR